MECSRSVEVGVDGVPQCEADELFDGRRLAVTIETIRRRCRGLESRKERTTKNVRPDESVTCTFLYAGVGFGA